MLDDEDTSFSLGFLSFSEPQRGLVACNDVTREVESTRGEEESSERAREREEKRENASESEFSSSFSVSLFHRPSFSALSLAAPPPPPPARRSFFSPEIAFCSKEKHVLLLHSGAHTYAHTQRESKKRIQGHLRFLSLSLFST